MPKRPQAPKPICFREDGVKYNFLNSPFKSDIKKGLDSEDADRRDSINRESFSSFCRADEKLYNKHFFSLPNGKTQQCVISKHSHVHVKYHLIFLNVFKLTSPSLSSLLSVFY